MLKTQSEPADQNHPLALLGEKNVLSRFVKNESRKSIHEIIAKFNESTPVKVIGARCVKKKKTIILQGGELTCFHFFKSSC